MEKKERNMRKQEDNYKDEVLSLRRVTKVKSRYWFWKI